jgi:hypothetical protein
MLPCRMHGVRYIPDRALLELVNPHYEIATQYIFTLGNALSAELLPCAYLYSPNLQGQSKQMSWVPSIRSSTSQVLLSKDKTPKLVHSISTFHQLWAHEAELVNYICFLDQGCYSVLKLIRQLLDYPHSA